MADVVSLSELRVDRSGDCRDWSVADMLRSVLDKIESGEIVAKMAVITIYIEDDKDYVRGYYAGGSRLELTGLLTEHVGMRCKV